MRITLTLAESVTGRLGGVVATKGRSGAQLRARRPQTQPRSAPQVTARHLTGSVAQLWRSIGPANQQTWNILASSLAGKRADDRSSSASGYNLFIRLNRNLATIAAPPQILAAPAPPSIPPLRTFLTTPGYNQPSPPQYLTSFPVYIDPQTPPGYYAVIRATKGLSPTKGNIRASDLRIVATFEAYPTFTADTLPGWLAAWGQPPTSGFITFEANLVHAATGFAGPRLRVRTSFTAPPIPPAQPMPVLFSMNDTRIAVVDDTIVSFGGVPAAGAN